MKTKNNIFFKFLITIMGILLIIVVFSFYKRPSLDFRIKNLKLETQAIYLIQRGTTGKLGNLAKDFNLKNKYASHLGIGFIKDGELNIYHIYVKKNAHKNNLFIETIEDFTKPEDLNYVSVWKLNNINTEKFESIKNTLISSEKENIIFDFDFDENNEKYYCSEFVVRALRKNDIQIMQDHKKKVVGFASQMLRKDSLIYFPVDGFEGSDKTTKIFEWIK
ncbi:hypothetical protein [Chryseobacterium sp. MMS23-Vi53]|uniref:hypothetical protein n=1 Tax=Chryseobacterium sp. MMS23-Vi53 TaxID=3386644 RepID=UPI0039EA51DF